ncbi:HD domain-containing protein [Paenibacillus hamazuiensis]|uniref:HD domain-containing protein n=1 Tax=Paenibacillus hamazuiensis TaxID=2936508 RepID=UPI00200E37BC|nr:HD domain-containing protein [Paenibacillus hamazuiensis]
MTIHYCMGTGRLFEPLYRLETQPHPLEAELLATPALRRLKLLHHYGAGSLCTPVVHSRLEHTMGVWALTAHFFPRDLELRLAALLHDAGHLPFSHAVEKPLGVSHHALTEAIIAEGEVARLLRKYGFRPERIIDLLGQDTPLTSRTTQLGLDHMDSFLRDTEAAGLSRMAPADIVRRARIHGCGVSTDEPAALALMDAILADHRLFLSPLLLAMDAFLAEAALAHAQAVPDFASAISAMTDYELLAALESSPVQAARDKFRVLVRQPHRIRTSGVPFDGSFRVEVRKVYDKLPWIDGKPAGESTPRATEMLAQLHKLVTAYHIGLN